MPPAEAASPAGFSGHAVGIDIGGTKIAAGLVDLRDGTILARRSQPTDATDGGRPALAAAIRLATELRDVAARQSLAVSGVGIGVPELVDRQGRILSTYNFRWAGRPIAEDFAAVAPAVVESDVRAAARAEAVYGAGRDRAIVVYVTIGTGVSYCLCLDGQPFAGANGFAIHFASSALPYRCLSCGSDQRPVVEEHCSGPAMVGRYRALSGQAIAGGAALLARAAAGDSAALAVIDDATATLGGAIAVVVNMLDPELVVLGGGLGLAGGLYAERLVAAIRQNIWADAARDLPVVPARLGTDAGIVGAAACAAADAGPAAQSSSTR